MNDSEPLIKEDLFIPSRPGRWRHRVLLAMLLAPGLGAPGLAGAPVPQPAVQPQPPDPALALGEDIRRIIEAPRFAAARWGIQVVSLDTGRVLFEHNAGKYFIPASNTKLFTAAMALQELGPELRIRTSLYAPAGPASDGVLAGDLVLFGRGDPTLMRPWTGGPPRPDPLESLARQLQDQGVRAIQGDLVGDDSFFTAPPYGPGWQWEDLGHAYGAEPTALTVHHNVVDLWVYPAPVPGRPCWMFTQPGQGLFSFANATTTLASGPGPAIRAVRLPGESTIRVSGGLAAGSPPVRLTVPVRDAALFAARLLGRTLARHGIQLRGQARSMHAQDRRTPFNPDAQVELGHLDSPPLLDLLRDMMKDSDNLIAQLVLLQAGARRPASGDTARRGLAAISAWLARTGFAPGDAVLEEGAGGSRRNLVKPEAIVRLLATMDRQPEAAAFRSTLPIAGVDGTLRHRMDGTAAQGNLTAKTGTLRDTHNLSGYVTSAAGERLAFALMLNNCPEEPGLASPRSALDAIADLLARYPAGAGVR